MYHLCFLCGAAAGALQVCQGCCLEGGLGLQHTGVLHSGSYRWCGQPKGRVGLLLSATDPISAEDALEALRPVTGPNQLATNIWRSTESYPHTRCGVFTPSNTGFALGQHFLVQHYPLEIFKLSFISVLVLLLMPYVVSSLPWLHSWCQSYCMLTIHSPPLHRVLEYTLSWKETQVPCECTLFPQLSKQSFSLIS